MIIPKCVENYYNNVSRTLDELLNVIRETLFGYCEINFFAYQQRKKSLTSFAEKIETGRFSALQEIDDLAASIIIIPELSKEPDVIDFLKEVFDVVCIKKRNSTRKAPDVFRFDSTRIICKLKNFQKIDESKYSILFEVQILTAFEHAWQVSTHSLSCKSDDIDWKILRLSSQLRAQVEQLDLSIAGYSEIKEQIDESYYLDVEIKKTICSYFKSLYAEKKIAGEYAPHTLTRFSDNIFSLLRELFEDGRIRNMEFVSKELKWIEDKITKEGVPKSVSLFQFILKCYLLERQLKKKRSDYILFVTEELYDIYPDLRKTTGSRKTITI